MGQFILRPANTWHLIVRIGSDCPVSAKFTACRKPLSQASTDTGDHLAAEEEASVKVQLTEEGRVARMTERWRHVLITLEAHPPCFSHSHGVLS